MSAAAAAQGHVIEARAAHALDPGTFTAWRLRLAQQRLDALGERVAALRGSAGGGATLL